MKSCIDCKYCYKDYKFGQKIWHCCYDEAKPNHFGGLNYTPGLIYGEIPDWCPYRSDKVSQEASEPSV